MHFDIDKPSNLCYHSPSGLNSNITKKGNDSMSDVLRKLLEEQMQLRYGSKALFKGNRYERVSNAMGFSLSPGREPAADSVEVAQIRQLLSKERTRSGDGYLGRMRQAEISERYSHADLARMFNLSLSVIGRISRFEPPYDKF